MRGAPAQAQQLHRPQHQQLQKPKKKTAQDLDADMEQYRRLGQGRMGLR